VDVGPGVGVGGNGVGVGSGVDVLHPAAVAAIKAINPILSNGRNQSDKVIISSSFGHDVSQGNNFVQSSMPCRIRSPGSAMLFFQR
jgi:hypothetical protein